jgi:hypothetical protein
MSNDPGKPLGRSVILAAEKTRVQRIQRLTKALTGRLEDPLPAVDALMAELAEGSPHAELWEQLHAAAARDGKEAALADAYKKCTDGPRMKRLPPEAQVAALMRAADYFQGMLGDGAAAEAFLERVSAIQPEHAEAFSRLEKRYEKALDATRLLELYAKVAHAPPRPVALLANQAYTRALQLSPKTPLSEAAAKRLVALVPTNPKLLDALDTHCCATKRHALACVLIEQAIAAPGAPPELLLQRRKRVMQLYVGDAATPDLAMPHVEAILANDPADTNAFEIGEKLLSARTVASRAASALREARRKRGY